MNRFLKQSIALCVALSMAGAASAQNHDELRDKTLYKQIVASNEKARHNVTVESEKVIGERKKVVLKILSEERLYRHDPAAVQTAMELAGLMRMREAVPQLSAHLDFPFERYRPSKDDPNSLRVIGNPQPGSIEYPSAIALAEIGLEAIPSILNRVREGVSPHELASAKQALVLIANDKESSILLSFLGDDVGSNDLIVQVIRELTPEANIESARKTRGQLKLIKHILNHRKRYSDPQTSGDIAQYMYSLAIDQDNSFPVRKNALMAVAQFGSKELVAERLRSIIEAYEEEGSDDSTKLLSTAQSLKKSLE